MNASEATNIVERLGIAENVNAVVSTAPTVDYARRRRLLAILAGGQPHRKAS